MSHMLHSLTARCAVQQYVDALAGLLVSVDPGDPTSRINDQVSTLMAEAVRRPQLSCM